eukprot:7892904-Alexandrium_andersonii.AAC.1
MTRGQVRPGARLWELVPPSQLASSRSALRVAASPAQHGLGRQAGLELLRKEIQADMEQRPERVLVKLGTTS